MFTSLNQQSTLPEIVQVLDRLPTDLVLKMKGDLTPDVLYPVHRELRVVMGRRFIVHRLKLLQDIEEEGIRRYLGCDVPVYLMRVLHYRLHHQYAHVSVTCDLSTRAFSDTDDEIDHQLMVNDRIHLSFTMNLARLDNRSVVEVVFYTKQRLARHLRLDDKRRIEYMLDNISHPFGNIQMKFTAMVRNE